MTTSAAVAAHGVSRFAAIVGITRTELLRVSRDRTGLFFIAVLPVLVIVVIGSSIGSVSGTARVGVVDLDRSTASVALIEALNASDRLDVEVVADSDTLAVDVRLDRLRAGLIIPTGYGDALARGHTAELEMIVDPSRTTSTAARTSVAAAVDRHAAVVSATRFTTERSGIDADRATRIATAVSGEIAPVPVRTEDVGTGGIDAGSPFSYPAAANLVLFTFINTVAVAGVIVESRRLGVTRRLLAGPVSPGTLVAGYATSRFLIALFQGALVVVAGALLFDVRWGSPVAVAALVVSFSMVAAAFGVLLGAVARTPEQTQSIGIPLGIAMGMLGGALWPLEFVPDWLRLLGHVTPHAWAMDGWVAVVFDDAGVTDVATELVVLAVFAVLVMMVGARALRRAVTRS